MRARKPKPLASSIAPRALALGPFSIVWDPSSTLCIRHARAADRAIFETLPGEAFVVASEGEAKVSESRGYFRVRERERRGTRGHSVDRFDRDGDAVVVSGVLSPPSGARFILRFSRVDDEQLGFELTFEGPGAERIAWTSLVFAADPDERVFGLGEQLTHLDLKGRLVPVLSQEPGIGRGIQPLTFVLDLLFGAGGSWASSNAPAPHFLTTALRSLFLESSEYSVFDFRDRARTCVRVHAGRMQGRILFGRSALELIEVYTRHAGRMPPLPEWLHEGATVAIQGGSEAVDRVLATLDEVRTPIAALWIQDWVGGRRTAIGRQLWWNWEVDRDAYPEWEALVRRLEARGIRVLTYVNPFLVDPSEKGSVTRNLHREALERGYFVRDREGRPYAIKNTSFSANLVDLTHPEARAWLKDVIRAQVLGSGASGWMADFGEALPFDAVLHDGTDPRRYHNRYPVEWARLNREAIADAGREGTVLFFTRAGYTDSPGSSTLFWLGDQLTSWRREDGLPCAIVGLLSSGFSGFSQNHSDVGGYIATAIPLVPFDLPLVTFTRDRELLLRWIELNAFTAAFRTHEGNRPDRHHQIDRDTETARHFARFARVFRALAPYRSALGAEAAAKGYPVVRHPWLHFPDDPVAPTLDLQLMLGPDFMVAPVTRPRAETVRVYLPRGRWVHLWTGEEVRSMDGAWFEVAAPIGGPAIFYGFDSAAGRALATELTKSGDLAFAGPRPVASVSDAKGSDDRAFARWARALARRTRGIDGRAEVGDKRGRASTHPLFRRGDRA